MVTETIIYLAVFSAIVVFMLLIDSKMGLKNKILLSLSAPIVGGLLVMLGTVFLLFLLALLLVGGVFYLFNKGRMNKWLQSKPRFGLYRYYFLS